MIVIAAVYAVFLLRLAVMEAPVVCAAAEYHDRDKGLPVRPFCDGETVAPAHGVSLDVGGEVGVYLVLALLHRVVAHIYLVDQQHPEPVYQQEHRQRQQQTADADVQHLRVERGGELQLLNQSGIPFPIRCG